MARTGRPVQHRARAFMILGLAACETSPPAPAAPEQTTATAAVETQQPTPQVPVSSGVGASNGTDVAGTGAAPSVLLVWDNISDLYQSFFSKSEFVDRLSDGLAGYANGPVNLHIQWDQSAFVGTIRLRILPDTLVNPQLGEGSKVPLQALAPLTTALATYRAEIASRFDIRVASFSVALESLSGARHCVFPVVGTPPPDGRLVSPCVELNGQEHCGTPEADGVVFARDVAEDLRACLAPQG